LKTGTDVIDMAFWTIHRDDVAKISNDIQIGWSVGTSDKVWK